MLDMPAKCSYCNVPVLKRHGTFYWQCDCRQETLEQMDAFRDFFQPQRPKDNK